MAATKSGRGSPLHQLQLLQEIVSRQHPCRTLGLSAFQIVYQLQWFGIFQLSMKPQQGRRKTVVSGLYLDADLVDEHELAHRGPDSLGPVTGYLRHPRRGQRFLGGEEQAAVKADRDAESDPADGGNQERRIGSEEQQASEEEPGPGQRRDASENQFADANRKLDQGGDDEESGQNAGEQQRESDSDSQRRGGDEALARQPPTADRRAQPQAPDPATGTRAQALSSEEQMAAQQWLRRIPDDPGGLLRRKFLYQYQQRARRPDGGSHQDWRHGDRPFGSTQVWFPRRDRIA